MKRLDQLQGYTGLAGFVKKEMNSMDPEKNRFGTARSEAAFKTSFLFLCFFVILLYDKPFHYLRSLVEYRLPLIAGIVAFVVMVMEARSRGLNFLKNLDGQIALYLGFTAMAFLSVIFSYWPKQSFEASIGITKILLLVLIMSIVLDSLKRIWGLIWLAILTLLVPAIGGLHLFLTGGIPPADDGVVRLAYIGQFANSNELAFTLAIYLPLLVSYLFTKKRLLAKLAVFSFIVLFLIDILLTASRAAYIGVMVYVVYLVLTMKKRIIILFLLIPIVILATNFDFSDHIKRVTTTSKELDDSAQTRLSSWEAGIAMGLSRPFVGVGINCFNLAYLEYNKGRDYNVTTSHNTFISVLAETGFLGALFFYLLVLKCFKDLIALKKNLKGSEEREEMLPLVTGLLGSMIIFVVCGFFNDYQFDSSTVLMMGLIAGLKNARSKVEVVFS